MIHAILVDDEVKVLRGLELLIEKFVPEIKVVAAASDPEKAVELIDNYRPDVVFLDISMPVLNGFQMLEKLSFRNFHLVFTTAHEEYGIQAIRQSALDYLLKPVDTKELKKIVEKINRLNENNYKLDGIIEALKKITERQSTRVALPHKADTEYVNPEDIVYIEASVRNSLVCLSDGRTVTVSKPLKDFEEQLCERDLNFMRVHLSFIINLNFMTRYLKENGGQVVMHGLKSIPVSKNKKEEVLKFLGL